MIDKEPHSYIFNGDKSTCTGCGACVQICPKQALVMKNDEDGFLYPQMDNDLCVKCGACDRTCPEVNDDQSNKDRKEQHCYLGTTSLESYYKESASIGLCTMLAESIVKSGGIVYGAFLDEEKWQVRHIQVSDTEGVERIRNSKYVQSDTGTTFAEVKQHLKDGKTVLYIGTPCQIAGLKAYLKIVPENLYTIDLICHGVTSPKLMPLEVKYWEKLFNSKITNFRFRSKRKYTQTNCGMVNFDLVQKNGKTKHIERFAGSSPTYHCFAYSPDGINYNLRLSCYSCIFKSKGRYGDLTIGDPWLATKGVVKNPLLRPGKIIRSLYSANTRKGAELLKLAEEHLIQEEQAYDDTFVQPAVCEETRAIPSKRQLLFENLDNEDYGTLVERIFECDLEHEHKKFAADYYKKAIKKAIKKLILRKD